MERVLVGRELEAGLVTLGLLTRQHVLLIGDPGTGKSALCRATGAIFGLREAECQLGKFVHRDEILGQPSLQAIREDKQIRRTEGYIAGSELGFLDEVWRASGGLLNSLLLLLNERVVIQDGRRERCPLVSVVSAANHWPAEENWQDLEALADRFLIRHSVERVAAEKWDSLLYGDFDEPEQTTDLDTLTQAQAEVEQVLVGMAARLAYRKVLDKCVQAGVYPGDRRARQCVALMQATAWMAGRDEVQVEDIDTLRWALWNDPRKAEQVRAIIDEVVDPHGLQAYKLQIEAETLVKATKESLAKGDIDTSKDQLMSLRSKLKDYLAAVKGWQQSPRVVKFNAFCFDQLNWANARLLDM